MPRIFEGLLFAPILLLAACGAFVPQKYLAPDSVAPSGYSEDGKIENAIVNHIQCEISKGIWRVWSERSHLNHVAWLYAGAPGTPLHSGKSTASHQGTKSKSPSSVASWGTSVTLSLTFDEQSGLNPGVSIISPFQNGFKVFPATEGGNVSSPQSFTLGLGASATAHATRVETIQFTYTNADLLNWAQKRFSIDRDACNKTNTGIMIDSDLKIDDFIYDKATIATLGGVIGIITRNSPPFNTFEEQITFVALLGGNVTPTWKFFRTAVDSNATLLSATRTNTNAITITLGPVTPATPTSPAQLTSAAAALHLSGVAANQTGQQIQSTMPGL